MIGIIDYGSGNVKAIANIYKRLNEPYFVTSEPARLKEATHLVLPGVGAFDTTMSLLINSGLRNTLDGLVLDQKVPIMGICVGMQIMAESSEEGSKAGLGWIKGKVKKINHQHLVRKPKLPHMGWNDITITRDNSILADINSKKGFYFLHSYYVQPSEDADVVATVDYGTDLTCVVQRENIIGIQFHPEKSHVNGVQVFRNFALI
jgi:glutamine amidotransferase